MIYILSKLTYMSRIWEIPIILMILVYDLNFPFANLHDPQVRNFFLFYCDHNNDIIAGITCQGITILHVWDRLDQTTLTGGTSLLMVNTVCPNLFVMIGKILEYSNIYRSYHIQIPICRWKGCEIDEILHAPVVSRQFQEDFMGT